VLAGLHERWNAISLRTKVTSVTVLLLTLGLLVSGIGTMAMLKPALIGQLDSQLQAVSTDLSKVVDTNTTVMMSSGAPSDYYYAVYDSHGLLMQQNWNDKSSAVRPYIPTGPTIAETTVLNGAVFGIRSGNDRVLYRAISTPVTFAGTSAVGSVVVALSTSTVERLLTTYLSIFLGFGIGVVIFGALLTRFMVTTTFAPLREVEKTAEAIADGDLSQRLPWSTPNTEVGRLNRALNTMLGRIDRAFSDRAKTIEQMRRFVGDASHELRTPLVSVRGYAELYRMGALQTPEEIGQAMERIEAEAIRMGVLVEDLLELARLDETRPLVLAEVNLTIVAHDASMDVRAQDPEREVRVVALDGSAHVPEVIIRAEENKIRQVVTNLLGNALRFTDSGSPLEIAIGTNPAESEALIAIVDHGEGIPESIRDKIFQRFWRADSSRTRETGGSGLGLAIVSSIVASHGGRVTVHETPGTGATFVVHLPIDGPPQTVA
jgi:two-component system OmpR family sensor kinase